MGDVLPTSVIVPLPYRSLPFPLSLTKNYLSLSLPLSLSLSLPHAGDYADLALNFEVSENVLGSTVSTELIPGGRDIPVTANNVVQYKALISDYWLTRRIAHQVRGVARRLGGGRGTPAQTHAHARTTHAHIQAHTHARTHTHTHTHIHKHTHTRARTRMRAHTPTHTHTHTHTTHTTIP